jgi:hypothetical protein
MSQELILHFTTREDAQQSVRILKKSGSSARLTVETTLSSMEMAFGSIDSFRAFLGSLSHEDGGDEDALGIASEIIRLEEEAFSRIISAIKADGGSYLMAAYEKADSLSDEELASLTQDARRVLEYVRDGYVEEKDDRLHLIREVDPGSHMVAVPIPLLLFPEKQALEEAGLRGERVVSSETLFLVQPGIDVIFCSDPTVLIDSIQAMNPEEESFVAFLEQFFLLLTLADEIVSLIQEGAATLLEITQNISAKTVSIDEEAYPLRFDVSQEMVQQLVDALRSAGRITGKDGRLKVR